MKINKVLNELKERIKNWENKYGLYENKIDYEMLKKIQAKTNEVVSSRLIDSTKIEPKFKELSNNSRIWINFLFRFF